MTKRVFVLFIVLCIVLPCFSALTAEQTAQKVSEVITGSKELKIEFSLNINGTVTNGQLKSSGNKFSISLPAYESWYNGKFLYTYSAKNNETTLVSPTASELLDSNPLLYVKYGGSGYNYKFASMQSVGKQILELTPRNAKSEIKNIIIVVNKNNYHPEKITVNSKGGTYVVTIKSIDKKVSLATSDFEYPRNKYPDAEIIDLR